MISDFINVRLKNCDFNHIESARILLELRTVHCANKSRYMFNKVFFLLSLALSLVSFTSIATETKVLTITTELNKNKFFSNEITRFEFEPSQLTLEHDPENETFKPADTTLYIESDIPNDNADILFSLMVLEKQQVCLDDEKNMIDVSDDFSTIKIGEQDMSLNEKLDFFFDDIDENSFKSATLPTVVTFGDLPKEAHTCSGGFTVVMELSL